MKWESVYEPPTEVIRAALTVLRWAESRGYKDWCLCGIGPYRPPLVVINRTTEAIIDPSQTAERQ